MGASVSMRTNLIPDVPDVTGCWKTGHREHALHDGHQDAPQPVPMTNFPPQRRVGPAQAQAELLIEQLDALLAEHSWTQRSPPGQNYGDLRMTMHTRLRAAESLMKQRGLRVPPETLDVLAETMGMLSMALRQRGPKAELKFWEACEAPQVMQLWGGRGGYYRDFGCQPGTLFCVRIAIKLEQPVGQLQLSVRATGLEEKVAHSQAGALSELVVKFRVPVDCHTFRVQLEGSQLQGPVQLSGLLIEDLGAMQQQPQPSGAPQEQSQFRSLPETKSQFEPWKLCQSLTEQNRELKNQLYRLQKKQTRDTEEMLVTNRLPNRSRMQQQGMHEVMDVPDEMMESWMQSQLLGSGHYDPNRSR